MTEMLYTLCESTIDFPPVDHALKDPNGLLAIGGSLSSERIIQAYKSGIFPWFSPGDPILWWSPDPRAVIFTDKIKINRTLRKILKRNQFRVTVNTSFSRVIEACADESFRSDGTWIVAEMMEAYQKLHQQGSAHSIEVWHEEDLVGGLYGVSINGYFSGESMFHRYPNASKVALVCLCTFLKQQNVSIIDCQLLNPFLESMGAENISRSEFIKIKNAMINHRLDVNMWHPKQVNDFFETTQTRS